MGSLFVAAVLAVLVPLILVQRKGMRPKIDAQGMRGRRKIGTLREPWLRAYRDVDGRLQPLRSAGSANSDRHFSENSSRSEQEDPQ